MVLDEYSYFLFRLSKYRLQGWKLVDFDGVMRGNPLLLPKAESEKLYFLKPE